MTVPDLSLVKTMVTIGLPEGASVYVHGFGSGGNVEWLARRGYKVTGGEISENAWKVARERLEKAELHADLRIVPGYEALAQFEDGSFDAIVAWQSLYYNDVNSLNRYLEQFARLTKEDGYWVISMADETHCIFLDAELLDEKHRIFRLKFPGQAGVIMIGVRNEAEMHELFPYPIIHTGYYESRLINERYDKHYVTVIRPHMKDS